MPRNYVYVDGESHFIRFKACAADVFGFPEAASRFCQFNFGNPGDVPSRVDHRRSQKFEYNESVKFVWDYARLESWAGSDMRSYGDFARGVYFTSFVGDPNGVQEARVAIRNYGFEPYVIHEEKQNWRKREGLLTNNGIIEKPKGCDLALATRMIADAAKNLYDVCRLFTSDADYLPVIDAVRNMGKVVWVYGFHDALPERSPFLFAPDYFIDLGLDIKAYAGSKDEDFLRLMAKPPASELPTTDAR
jgi:uncharacterized LabA/DUF88 family protein